MARRVRERDFEIRSVGLPYALLGAVMLKWEYKSLGWKTKGREDYYEHDGYETTYTDHGSYISSSTREKRRHIKRIWFKRPRSYKKEFFFWLTELLINLNIKIRGILWTILGLPALIAFGAYLIGLHEILPYLMYYAYAVLGSWALTIVLPLLARIWRKLFRLDEKTDAFLEEYGYMAWSEYDEYE